MFGLLVVLPLHLAVLLHQSSEQALHPFLESHHAAEVMIFGRIDLGLQIKSAGAPDEIMAVLVTEEILVVSDIVFLPTFGRYGWPGCDLGQFGEGVGGHEGILDIPIDVSQIPLVVRDFPSEITPRDGLDGHPVDLHE